MSTEEVIGEWMEDFFIYSFFLWLHQKDSLCAKFWKHSRKDEKLLFSLLTQGAKFTIFVCLFVCLFFSPVVAVFCCYLFVFFLCKHSRQNQ